MGLVQKLCKKGIHTITTKYCNKCYKANRRASHLEEERAERRAWSKANPQKVKEWRKKNIEKVRQTSANWQKNNRNKIKISASNWAKRNPGKINAFSANRKASKLERTPKWLTKDQLKEIRQWYIDIKDLQWLSDLTDPLQVDHIIPLQGEIVSGLHVPWNLQILTKSQNLLKGNRI